MGKKKDKDKKAGGAPPSESDAPPPAPGKMAPPGGAAPSGGAKPGWRRVSTRQWIRDFRDHIAKFQTYPYKTMCGMFFWSFGYYPDMVPEATYNKYISKYPPVGRNLSIGSGQFHLPHPIPGAELSSDMSSTTAMSAASLSATDDNANLPRTSSALSTGTAAAGADAEGGGKKKKKGKKDKAGGRESISSETSDASSAAGSKAGKKKKKKGGDGEAEKRDSEVSAASAASGATEASEGTKKKKKKKGDKGDDGGGGEEGGDDASSSKKGKGKKGKKDKDGVRPSTVSGNIAFDPQVYDLSTLTVMNLPEGATAGKLKKLFPGATVTMEGGGASVKFPDTGSAEPFFTKEVSLDGQSLVISPKLKS